MAKPIACVNVDREKLVCARCHKPIPIGNVAYGVRPRRGDAGHGGWTTRITVCAECAGMNDG